MSLIGQYGYAAVKVPIVAELHHKGCFVTEVEGYALSRPYGPELDTVCLMEFHDGKLIVGPELPKPLGPFWDRESVLGKVLANALWDVAQSPATKDSLHEAYIEYLSEKTGEGAKADHLWNQRESYLD